MDKMETLIKNLNKQAKEEIITIGLNSFKYNRIPFTSPRMNYCTFGGLPVGKLIEFYGEEHGGKTTTALDIVANYQHSDDSRKVLYCDCENTLDVEWARKLGVDVDNMYILQPKSQSAEQIFEFICNAVDTGEIGLFVIDSLAASSGYGLLIDILSDKKDQGLSFEELVEFALDIRNKVQHWFFSTDLTFYIKGGRVSKTAGFVGSMLNICPLLNVNIEGKLIPREKVRTKKKVYQRVVDIMEERALGGPSYNGKCFISQSACREDAEEVASLIEARFPKLNGKVMINDIGTTIGSHTGPGTVAVFFVGDEKDA